MKGLKGKPFTNPSPTLHGRSICKCPYPGAVSIISEMFFTLSEIIFTVSKTVFIILEEIFCYKFCNTYYKAPNIYYKVCNTC